jgi:hypothetical protein
MMEETQETNSKSGPSKPNTAPNPKAKKENITKHLPFILFLSGLLVVYIYITHRTERKLRAINTSTKEVKELYSEYITLQTEILNGSRSSNLEQKMLDYGIKPPTETPKIIKE